MKRRTIIKYFGGGALGFTLAEVLVTLGIIGVVSAMTLPTLVKNHQRQVYVTQLHKVYNELSQATEQVITDSNAVSLAESRFARGNGIDFLNAYFKTVKLCGSNEASDCLADEYKNLNGDNVPMENSILDSCAILASGASVCIHNYGGDGTAALVIDVNGKQPPNIMGRDLFTGAISEDGSVGPTWEYDENNGTCEESVGDSGIDGDPCWGRIIHDGWKMEY